MTLEHLLARAKKQDMQSLAALHDQLYPLVYRYVSYRLDDSQVCEDITSETFVRLLDVLNNRRGRTIQDLRAWLIGTAAHLVSDHYRQQYRRPESDLELHEDLSDGHTPEQVTEQRQIQQAVRQAMCRLTEVQQHVLALRFSQELSLEETARILGKSVNAVKVLQFRALAALRRAMDERGKV